MQLRRALEVLKTTREKGRKIHRHKEDYKSDLGELEGINRDLGHANQDLSKRTTSQEAELLALRRKNAALQTQQLRMDSREPVPTSSRPFITLPPATRDTTDFRKAMAARDRARLTPSPTSEP